VTPKDEPPSKRLTESDVRRLFEEAKARGEPTTPILRRFVVETLDGVIERLEAESKIN
jgi:hypothetical protein